jgi:hypothetical protein
MGSLVPMQDSAAKPAKLELPMLQDQLSSQEPGPVPALAVQAALPHGDCLPVRQLLERIPQASMMLEILEVRTQLASSLTSSQGSVYWPYLCSISLQIFFHILLQAAGLAELLDARDAQATILVPVDGAYTKSMDLWGKGSLSPLQHLLAVWPQLAVPIAGYHGEPSMHSSSKLACREHLATPSIPWRSLSRPLLLSLRPTSNAIFVFTLYTVLLGLWPTGALVPGVAPPTAASLDGWTPLKIRIDQQAGAEGPMLAGTGPTTTRIILGDAVACGPVIVHLVDAVLLPFQPGKAAAKLVLGSDAL